MKQELPIATAKARFAEFVRRAESGETVVLTRHGRPVAQLAPAPAGNKRGHETSGEIHESASRYETAPRERIAVPAPGASESRHETLERLLEESIWPRIPDAQLGVPLEKREREEILGYGSRGV